MVNNSLGSNTKPSTNTTHFSHACNFFYNPLFIPHSKSVVAFICSERYLHYWDTKQQKNIKGRGLPPYTPFFMQNPLINILDISPSGTQIITTINGFQEKKNYINSYSSTIFIHWILKQYTQENSNYINRDIFNLLDQYLSILPFYID